MKLEKERQSELDAKGGRAGISETKAITFSSHLVAKSAVLRDFVKNEVFAELCCDLIGPDVNLYWDQAVYKKPENPRRFPWHQDDGYTFVVPQQYLTCWTPLTTATVDNGCPQIVPGLHKLGTLKHTYVDPLGMGVLCGAASRSRAGASGARRHCGILFTFPSPDWPQRNYQHSQVAISCNSHRPALRCCWATPLRDLRLVASCATTQIGSLPWYVVVHR